MLATVCARQLEASAIAASVGTSGGRIRRALQQSFGGIAPCKSAPGDPEDCGDCAIGGHTGIGMCMPTFSIAYAATKFADAAVRAVSGHRCVETNAFVVNRVNENFNAEFATVPVLLGRQGVLKIVRTPTPTECEANLLEAARELLRKDLAMATRFLVKEYGPSERPTKEDGCPGDVSAANIFNVCGESFYPELPPPCPVKKQCGPFDKEISVFRENFDPCEELCKRKE